MGRLCAVRKSQEAIELAHQRIRRQASKYGSCPAPETFVYAQFVMVFTTIPPARLSAEAVLRWYRIRWQIELVFKRFKHLARMGHLPTYDESARAWLYGSPWWPCWRKKCATMRNFFQLGLRLAARWQRLALNASSPLCCTGCSERSNPSWDLKRC